MRVVRYFSSLHLSRSCIIRVRCSSKLSRFFCNSACSGESRTVGIPARAFAASICAWTDLPSQLRAMLIIVDAGVTRFLSVPTVLRKKQEQLRFLRTHDGSTPAQEGQAARLFTSLGMMRCQWSGQKRATLWMYRKSEIAARLFVFDPVWPLDSRFPNNHEHVRRFFFI